MNWQYQDTDIKILKEILELLKITKYIPQTKMPEENILIVSVSTSAILE